MSICASVSCLCLQDLHAKHSLARVEVLTSTGLQLRLALQLSKTDVDDRFIGLLMPP